MKLIIENIADLDHRRLIVREFDNNRDDDPMLDSHKVIFETSITLGRQYLSGQKRANQHHRELCELFDYNIKTQGELK
ncbi:MAG TPA: hypothetical protein VIH90_06105 [Candidatus Saccharimonadales bacterium]